MIGTTTMNTTITYGPVVDLQPPHVVGGQQTFAVVGDQGIRQTTGRNAHAVVAVWGRVSEKDFSISFIRCFERGQHRRSNDGDKVLIAKDRDGWLQYSCFPAQIPI